MVCNCRQGQTDSDSVVVKAVVNSHGPWSAVEELEIYVYLCGFLCEEFVMQTDPIREGWIGHSSLLTANSSLLSLGSGDLPLDFDWVRAISSERWPKYILTVKGLPQEKLRGLDLKWQPEFPL